MYIEKNGLKLRNATNDDCQTLADWWNDGSVMAHAGFPNGLGTTAEEIQAKIADDSDMTKRRLIIEWQGMPIGEMSYYNLDDGDVEIGIKICNQDFQEQHLGRRALSMLIAQLFSMGFTCIILDTNLKNERAQHVYEKLGFTKVGIRYDDWKDQLGVLQSSVDYELTQGDFVDLS